MDSGEASLGQPCWGGNATGAEPLAGLYAIILSQLRATSVSQDSPWPSE